uniref:Fatty acyl-CoA reductase n=2 Tax=Lutzomyia longipalpis TaxID=7200 RepID=A0A1B0CS61_LUTLO
MESTRTEIEQHEVKHFSASGSNLNDYVSIPQFYTDRSVFITGGTGFMGKVLVEKLLRSCPGIKNIYLLIRPKRGQEVKARLNDLLGAPLFDTLRRERPNDLNKVIPIYGDITLEKLGISENDQALLCRTVSIVFHSAATVKFDEKLKLSVAINMLGTKRLVELCHRMMSLDALVHVSTAYCNCDRTEVSEVIYAPPYNPNDIISLVEWLPENMLDDLTPSLIGKRPNTYTFTKALAEHMLLNEAGNLPVAIVRPSIVLSSLNEPLPGWLDNLNGPTGIVSAVGKGVFKTMMGNEQNIADLIPVDIVINLMIATAWRTATIKPSSPTIYNCCTGLQKPILWGQFVSKSIDYMRKHPMEGVFWYPTGTFRLNAPLNATLAFLLHIIPAHFLDLFSRILGKRPIMVKIQGKLCKAVECLTYFTTNQWRFKDDNVRELITHLSPKDRDLFDFDVTHISWERYLEGYVLGFREYLFKQSADTLPSCRRHMWRLYWIDQITKLLAIIFFWRFLMKRSKKLRDVWTKFLHLLIQMARLIPFL